MWLTTNTAALRVFYCALPKTRFCFVCITGYVCACPCCGQDRPCASGSGELRLQILVLLVYGGLHRGAVGG